MVKCAILVGKDNHPYLMILFVCLILCSPESHPHSTSIELASLPTLTAFFMWQSVRFSTWKRILPSTAAPSGCTFCYKTVTLEFYERERKENWSTPSTGQFLHQGSERSPVASSYVCKFRKTVCHRAWTSDESMAGRDGHLAQKVNGSSPCPWLMFTAILSSTRAKTQRSFRLQRSRALIPAKWCRVSRLWSSLAPLWLWGCLVGPATNCSKMKVPW